MPAPAGKSGDGGSNWLDYIKGVLELTVAGVGMGFYSQAYFAKNTGVVGSALAVLCVYLMQTLLCGMQNSIMVALRKTKGADFQVTAVDIAEQAGRTMGSSMGCGEGLPRFMRAFFRVLTTIIPAVVGTSYMSILATKGAMFAPSLFLWRQKENPFILTLIGRLFVIVPIGLGTTAMSQNPIMLAMIGGIGSLSVFAFWVFYLVTTSTAVFAADVNSTLSATWADDFKWQNRNKTDIFFGTDDSPIVSRMGSAMGYYFATSAMMGYFLIYQQRPGMSQTRAGRSLLVTLCILFVMVSSSSVMGYLFVGKTAKLLASDDFAVVFPDGSLAQVLVTPLMAVNMIASIGLMLRASIDAMGQDVSGWFGLARRSCGAQKVVAPVESTSDGFLRSESGAEAGVALSADRHGSSSRDASAIELSSMQEASLTGGSTGVPDFDALSGQQLHANMAAVEEGGAGSDSRESARESAEVGESATGAISPPVPAVNPTGHRQQEQQSQQEPRKCLGLGAGDAVLALCLVLACLLHGDTVIMLSLLGGTACMPFTQGVVHSVAWLGLSGGSGASILKGKVLPVVTIMYVMFTSTFGIIECTKKIVECMGKTCKDDYESILHMFHGRGENATADSAIAGAFFF